MLQSYRRALALAREQRGLAHERSGAAGAGSGPDALGDRRPITYSKTRVVPVSRDVLQRNRLVDGSEMNEATAAYNILRRRIMQKMSPNGWNALAVTSTAPAHGKTLTSINLALSMAREQHHTVLLADMDLARPTVHKYFELSPQHGLEDYLHENTPLSEILVNPGIDGLVVLPARQAVQRSSECLASPKMARLVKELKRRYPSRFLIFDLPPLLTSDDALAFVPYVDAAVLVVSDGKTTRADLRRAIELLGSVPLLGTVLNDVEYKLKSHYYYLRS